MTPGGGEVAYTLQCFIYQRLYIKNILRLKNNLVNCTYSIELYCNERKNMRNFLCFFFLCKLPKKIKKGQSSYWLLLYLRSQEAKKRQKVDETRKR